MSITTYQERPDSPDAFSLIQELEAILSPLYPDESRHGYTVQKLIEQNVAFFVVRSNEEAAGCGGVQFFTDDPNLPYGELKRMYVRPVFRGQGIARHLLNHLEAVAASRTIATLRLETGIHQLEAIRLYERNGFYRIGAFGAYTDDPLSRYFEKRISVVAKSTAIDRE